MTTAPAVTSRLQRMGDLLEEEGIELLLVSPSADLRYLTGFKGHASERPTLLAVRPRTPSLLVIPQFEAALAGDLPDIRILPWSETQSPYVVLSEGLDGIPAGATIAVSDQTWASVLLHLQETFHGARFVAASFLLRRLRMRKSREELDLLSQAARCVDTVFTKLVQGRLAGRTEQDIAREIVDLTSRQGLETAEWGPIVASGPNSASPHHMAGERELQKGDAVVLDFGGSIDGYQADITRTVHVGPPDDEFRQVYEVVHRAQEAGVQAARAGVAAQHVDRVTREVIQSAGYGELFTHRTGHGIGLEDHEEPYIVEGNSLVLEAGMTFSVEPGIYLPGGFGVRIEDVVAAGDDGGIRLNQATRELVEVE